MGTHTDITIHKCQPSHFPKNPYSTRGQWKSLSRAKLDAVEELLVLEGGKVIWIDLDTLVFVDLQQSFQFRSSWVVGYQHGGCDGRYDCNKESKQIQPEYDALGDLWSLDLRSIQQVRKYELNLLQTGQLLPKYDLQGYFSMMLHAGEFPPSMLLHRFMPYNFGFFCSNFKHPNSTNLEITVRHGLLQCPERKHVNMARTVGSISFTANCFQKMFATAKEVDFQFIQDLRARKWFQTWFSTIPSSSDHKTALRQ
eukprot:CAMPEP_0174586436 /NCGR_PEP_ID=MMETSP0929-20130131/26621_1 /TAXON_ID=548131 ORGANISM="Ostreococcus mediterraneus, Strain clade-D-RCC2572" /NCGR_SAMPLE_ID=MMETSP0929 /ASSEMBLY_ACC=CAM_ASM_000573 /LENGTH=253 /DNA_ID=CAMNT_0015768449 /DNA_START=357 /DNA_END=1118 /DNA_ORIENTATION=-